MQAQTNEYNPQHDQWIARLFQFLTYAGVGAFFIFLNVYYRSELGLTSTQIGLLSTAGSLISVVSSILWGMFSDRSGKTRLLFGMALSGVIVSVLLLSAVKVFWLVLLVGGVYSLFYAAMAPMVDSTTLRVTGQHREQYALYRVWGTIGFIITSMTMGYVYERFGLRLMFPAYALIMAVFLLTSQRISNQPLQISSSIGSLGKSLLGFVQQPAWLFFAGSVLLTWIANSGMLSFLGIVIKEMSGSDSLVGWASATPAISEIPLFLYGPVLLRKLGSRTLMVISFIGFGIRLFLYSIMPSPAWTPFIGLMNCVSFAPLLIGSIAYANELAPDHLKATSQGLLAALTSLASVLGGVFNGWLLDQFGRVRLFEFLSLCCWVALLLFVFGQFSARRAKSP